MATPRRGERDRRKLPALPPSAIIKASPTGFSQDIDGRVTLTFTTPLIPIGATVPVNTYNLGETGAGQVLAEVQSDGSVKTNEPVPFAPLMIWLDEQALATTANGGQASSQPVFAPI